MRFCSPGGSTLQGGGATIVVQAILLLLLLLLLLFVCCVSGYGLTEASPATHVCSDDDIKYHTVGVAIQNTQFKVVDYFILAHILCLRIRNKLF